ncbi:type 2 isopentenyl-diphosphate Delta-isomerase [Motiliproteus sp. SC1-56]|uniref:type 2 isopentenyl-diphosphate Delta-isomerase n=1 Tax=Motiliproteus sp. SC1-56 TaxID=2799565 RepID=UPI001A8CE3AB|nr:type 2 isopentenyl-diphosphate Delta-isomerase [Motiliproteus sp. SC1-56]
MSDPTNSRKVEHIRVIERDAATDRQAHHFDRLHLRHRALPQVDLAAVDPSLELMGRRLSFPLLISSMTGGDHALVRTINRNLAIAAEATGVALAVGSQRVMFSSPQSRASFELRELAPNTLLLGNLGAVQLNRGFGLAECREAVACLQADGLFLHLNPLQEAVQPEGDTDFSGLAKKIGSIASRLEVPVILKEVGAGLAPEDIALGLAEGVRYFDVAGAGGTSWSRIEHHRHRDAGPGSLGLAFQDWGIPTPLALRLARPYMDQATIIASGGLRTGIDMVKSVILGGSLCGMAAPFLKPAMESPEKVVAVIEDLKKEFCTAMFLLGVPDLGGLRLNDALLLEEQ